MIPSRYRSSRLLLPVITVVIFSALLPGKTPAAGAFENVAFPDKFMIRLASYSVQNADTDMTVLSSTGVGTGFSFADDLGGDENITIPRLDAYYRFNSRHRIEFSSFRIERDGKDLLAIELDIGDQTFSVGDVVVSDINYELFKIGYAYSFYHSPGVELSVTAGLNVTTYEFNYQLEDGSSADSSEATGPLPMFGLRMSYAINPKWSLHYLSEVFFINIGDDFEGSFQNLELTVEYRFQNNLVLGAGATRFSIDVDAADSDWNGRIVDSHGGLLVFGSYYF